MRRILLIGASVAALVAMGGVAWGATTIHCPNDPQNNNGPGYCEETQGDDVIIGTSGNDFIVTNEGDDLVRAGAGDDLLGSSESDAPLGKDENHGGPGADDIIGNLDSEKHFGGRGNDTIVDWKSAKHPDVFRCGAGHDVIYYNKGLDKVSSDCEVRHPASKDTIQQPA